MASLLGPDGSPVKLSALRGTARMLAAGPLSGMTMLMWGNNARLW
jgi:hypothetical protein